MLRTCLVGLFLIASTASAQPRPVPTRVEVAPGVHVFQSAPYGDVGLDGNSVVIVGDDGVLVFDSNGTPAVAHAVLSEIRKLTRLPVKYLVHSHWHWDHWYGAQVYRDSFPGLSVIAHARARVLMAGPAIAFNQPGLDQQLPAHIREVENRAATGDSAAAAHLARDRFFLEQKRSVRHVLPTITYSDSLTMYLGRRVVQLRHHDRAITPGDTYLWLPDERVLVLGDLLINPVTFALFCYPRGWIATLDAIDAMDAAVLVPGHGAPMRDERLLHATRALLVRERTLATGARARGLTVDQAKAELLADSTVRTLRATITGGDARLNESFALYLVDWFVRRMYQELDGTLDDTIPRLP